MYACISLISATDVTLEYLNTRSINYCCHSLVLMHSSIIIIIIGLYMATHKQLFARLILLCIMNIYYTIIIL